MKTLTIFVRTDGLVFDLEGAKLDWDCPYLDGRRWWRVWAADNFPPRWQEAALTAGPACAMRDVLQHHVKEIKIVSSLQKAIGGFLSSTLACDFYDALLKLLSNPPYGTPSYQVTLHDVQNVNGLKYYPASSTEYRVGHFSGPKANLQNMPRRVGKMPELAAGYSPKFQELPRPKSDAADALARAFACPPPQLSDYEKLEARVTALETARRADWWAFRKPITGGPSRPLFVDLETFAPPPPQKTDYSKMVLRIGLGAIAGLNLPENAAKLRRRSDFVFGRGDVDELAKKLRELKVKELTLRRHSGAPVENMTKWLTAIVDAHSPVMKIISDPEMMK
jgi:hypothetical protein